MSVSCYSYKGCLVAPTLSIGSVLLQQAALQASFHYNNVEIVESRPDPSVSNFTATYIYSNAVLNRPITNKYYEAHQTIHFCLILQVIAANSHGLNSTNLFSLEETFFYLHK